jgi:hypothetical protein
MSTLFEMTPNNEDIFNMTVPSGEPCGCYDKRGCLDSMFCSCECACCLVQRQVDAAKTCFTCRKHKAVQWIGYYDSNGDESIRRICIDCYRTHLIGCGLLEPIEEEEEEEERENSTDSDSDSEDGYYWRVGKDGRIEYMDDEHDYDPREEQFREEWEAMDEEERRDATEAYYRWQDEGSPCGGI